MKAGRGDLDRVSDMTEEASTQVGRAMHGRKRRESVCIGCATPIQAGGTHEYMMSSTDQRRAPDYDTTAT